MCINDPPAPPSPAWVGGGRAHDEVPQVTFELEEYDSTSRGDQPSALGTTLQYRLSILGVGDAHLF